MLHKMGGNALPCWGTQEKDRHYQNEEGNNFRSRYRIEDTFTTIRHYQAIQPWGDAANYIRGVEKKREQGICGPSLEKTPYPRRKLKLKTIRF
jgi:hypothetical protein